MPAARSVGQDRSSGEVPNRCPTTPLSSEPGVRRFDVLRDEADPAHVVLNEVYVDQAAADAHKQTAHYGRWRDAVAGMMAQPRTSTRFTAVFPAEDDW